jgi:hypothetical protein
VQATISSKKVDTNEEDTPCSKVDLAPSNKGMVMTKRQARSDRTCRSFTETSEDIQAQHIVCIAESNLHHIFVATRVFVRTPSLRSQNTKNQGAGNRDRQLQILKSKVLAGN